MLTTIEIALLAALGGFLSRLCGRKSVIPFGLEQWLYALPYGLIFLGYWQGIPAYLPAVFGKRTGHGQYIHLGYLPRQDYEQDEPLDPIIRLFFGEDRGGAYWRCVAGLVLTGMAVTLIPGVIYGLQISPLCGSVIALSGASKGVAYQIGWFLRRKTTYVMFPTKIGEILTGVFGWGTLAAIFFIK